MKLLPWVTLLVAVCLTAWWVVGLMQPSSRRADRHVAPAAGTATALKEASKEQLGSAPAVASVPPPLPATSPAVSMTPATAAFRRDVQAERASEASQAAAAAQSTPPTPQVRTIAADLSCTGPICSECSCNDETIGRFDCATLQFTIHGEAVRYAMACTDFRLDDAVTDNGEHLSAYPVAALGLQAFLPTYHEPDSVQIVLPITKPSGLAKRLVHGKGSFAIAKDGPLRVIRLSVAAEDGPWLGLAGFGGAAVRLLAPRNGEGENQAQPIQPANTERCWLETLLTMPAARLFALVRAYSPIGIANFEDQLTIDDQHRIVARMAFSGHDADVASVELAFFDPAALIQAPFEFTDLRLGGSNRRSIAPLRAFDPRTGQMREVGVPPPAPGLPALVDPQAHTIGAAQTASGSSRLLFH